MLALHSNEVFIMEILDYIFYGVMILAAAILPIEAVYLMMEEDDADL